MQVTLHGPMQANDATVNSWQGRQAEGEGGATPSALGRHGTADGKASDEMRCAI